MPLEMLDLPLELIELIVDRLPDDDSLRSCCLVASIFRRRCQQRLWCSLHLQVRVSRHAGGSRGRSRTYTEIAAILNTSPHLAGYVTKVYMHLSRMSNWANQELAAESILRRLTHVRKARISGSRTCSTEHALVAEVLDWTLEILRAHGMMARLLLHRVKLPLDVLCRVLRSAPSIDFGATSVAHSSSISSPSTSGSPPGCAMKTLQVVRSPAVAALLLRPEFAPYTSSLGVLSFEVVVRKESNRSNFALCFLAAQTLEFIHLGFLDKTVSDDAGSVLPSHLPPLRHLVVSFHTHHGGATWLPPPFLMSLLSSSSAPTLAHITLNFIPKPAEDITRIFYPDNALSELDRALDIHPTVKRVSWHVVHLGPANFKEVSAALRRALRKSSAKGLLVIKGLSM
ncbi:hypothetical protein C8F01DRAFT_1337709 [Mycena amicta]|nr:hypothetical protein C8F01DRAFT_1337709 [Mycena amicta]